MLIPDSAEICRPPLGCFSKHWPRIFGERMERREAVCEGEKYQARPVRNKGEGEGGIGRSTRVGNRDGKKCRDYNEKGYTRQGGARLKATKE
jgi:hypothetical protein